jgi:PPOX class probable F420-dependent enzyme
MTNPEVTQASLATGRTIDQPLAKSHAKCDPRSGREPGAETPCRLTTFAWTGAGIETRACFASSRDRLYLRLADSSPEVQRIWNRAHVRLVPCTEQGRPTGPALEGDARVLGPGDDEFARQAMGAAPGRSASVLGQQARNDELVYVEIVPAGNG